jgi:hypothetical protein
MIKYGFPVLIEPILIFFNLIFEKGEFPKLCGLHGVYNLIEVASS